MEVHYLYGQGDLMATICKQSVMDVAGPTGSHLKAALPSTYNSTSSKAHTFLTECQTFMCLNWPSFPNNQVKILWALQLCLDKAVNWKQIQMELLGKSYFIIMKVMKESSIDCVSAVPRSSYQSWLISVLVGTVPSFKSFVQLHALPCMHL